MDLIQALLAALLESVGSWERVHERLSAVEDAVAPIGAAAPELAEGGHESGREFVRQQQRRVMKALLPCGFLGERDLTEVRGAVTDVRRLVGRVLDDEDELTAEMAKITLGL